MPVVSPPLIRCPHCKAGHVPSSGELVEGVYAANCQACGHFFKTRAVPTPKSQFSFTVNGQTHTVGNQFSAGTTLNDFLRDTGISHGTKVMCREAGCGCCTVAATLNDPVTNKPKTININSCLCPLYIVEGWTITTTEGLGNGRTGYHQIHQQLAAHNGTQCGYCSPGMVMAMYSFLQKNPSPTMAEVEDHFDGNLCRCTGYRSILDAMKSFAKDAPHHLKATGVDIEDLTRVCKRTGEPCRGQCGGTGPLQIVFASSVWYKPTSLADLYSLLNQHTRDRVRMIFGNTASGVYSDLKLDNFDTLIDIRDVPELNTHTIGTNVVLGGNITITTAIDLLREACNNTLFSYCSLLADHMARVGNTPLRNAASVAGNLVLKHYSPDFQSDIFVVFAAVGAIANIASSVDGKVTQYSMLDFLDLNLAQKVILSIELPPLDAGVVVRCYKIMPVAVNSHSYVSAAFRFPVDRSNNCTITAKPSIVYAGISFTLNNAEKTEQYLVGKALGDAQTLKGALQTLQQEIKPDEDPLLSSAAYRKSLCLSLFYKTCLVVCGNVVGSRIRTGGDNLVRPVSSGKQDFPTKQDEWPLTKPIPKLTAIKQAAGEAVYVNDKPLRVGELHAAFVTTIVGNARIQRIDASPALAMSGVVKFLSAPDVPGTNNCFPGSAAGEELFCSNQVLYAGQPVGLIVAESQQIADAAAKMVKVYYTDIQPPLVDIREAIRQKSFFTQNMPKEMKIGDAASAISSAAHQITGDIQFGGQSHFCLETMICRSEPTEVGISVFPATQWIDLTQKAVAMVLGIEQNKIQIEVSRLGGSYGAKLTRSFSTSCASALAAHLLQRPVKLMMNFNTQMETTGKRPSYYAQYNVGVSDAGLLQGIKLTYYSECGALPNDQLAGGFSYFGDNVYNCPNWDIIPVGVKMNTPPTTYARGPGATPAIFVMETIMEHVAESLGKSALEVKTLNMYQKGQKAFNNYTLSYCNIRELASSLSTSAQIAARQAAVDVFNQNNRWKKKGLAVVPTKYIMVNDSSYNALVNIYAGDGSVTVTHAGIENGQGINTKVAQVCAYELGIPLDSVKVLPTNSSANANTAVTGGSTTSEQNCEAVISACMTLNARMAPVKATMPNATWLELVKACYQKGVDLSALAWVYGSSDRMYQCYGITCTEVELDVLTGEYLLLRSDILYDCGESMNPEIDIGQVEGAFVMGLGLWLTEKIKYDPVTGRNLTNTAWEYKPPSAKDIPVDFRVQLLKNAPNPVGVLRSKAVGEPPLCMSCSALFALKHAISASRKDVAQTDHFPLNGPATVENVQQQCMCGLDQFVYQ
ncbi:xanthine dehydrogenase-like [Liolophura sinensis]|uniref:xanthine dehydrogenase-like n=1 Tax=Liolophura sinensis TaxID=3198878 RepID=UPI0031590E8D